MGRRKLTDEEKELSVKRLKESRKKYMNNNETWQERFDREFQVNETVIGKKVEVSRLENIRKEMLDFIQSELERQMDKYLEQLKRIELDLKASVCDCGESLKDTDAYYLVVEALYSLTEAK